MARIGSHAAVRAEMSVGLKCPYLSNALCWTNVKWCCVAKNPIELFLPRSICIYVGANENKSPMQRGKRQDQARAIRALQMARTPFSDADLKELDRKLARISSFRGSGANADLDRIRFVLADAQPKQLKSFIELLIIVFLLLKLLAETALLRACAICADSTDLCAWRSSDAGIGAFVAKLRSNA